MLWTYNAKYCKKYSWERTANRIKTLHSNQKDTKSSSCMSINTNCSKGNKPKHISSAQIWKTVQAMAICSHLCKDQKLKMKTHQSKYSSSKKDQKSTLSPMKFFTEEWTNIAAENYQFTSVNGYEDLIIFWLDWHREPYVPSAVILGVNSHGQTEVLKADINLTGIAFAPVLTQ